MRRMYTVLVGLFFLLGGWLHAQSNRNAVQIHINKDGNGSSIVIDGEEIYVDGVNLQEIMEEVQDAIPRNLRDKIVITYDGEEPESYDFSDFNYNFDWQDDDQPKWSGRPLLGVYLGGDSRDDRNDCACGVRISKVTRGGAAEQAGLRAGDYITFIDDYEINSESDLVKVKRNYQAGDRIRLDYLRDGQMYVTNVTFQGERRSNPAPAARPSNKKAYIGVYPANVSSNKASCKGLNSNDGVYLNGVTSHGGAKAAGLQKGDVITEINGQELEDVSDLTRVLAQYSPGDRVSVRYFSDGNWRNTTVTLGDENGIAGYGRAPRPPRPPAAPRPPRAPEPPANSSAKAYLGVTLDEIRGTGVSVSGVSSQTAASVAGLRKGDIIILMDDVEIEEYDDIRDVMRRHRPGDQIWVGFIRNDNPERVLVTLGQRGVPMYDNQRPSREWVDRDREREERERERAEERARQEAQAAYEQAQRQRERELEQQRKQEEQRFEQERERIRQERERLAREQERLREEQERLARERERMERESRDNRYDRDRQEREYTYQPRRNDNRDMAFNDRPQRRDDSELGVADRLIQEIEGRRTDDNMFRGYIENPTLNISDFEVFPNPNQGRFRLAFETEDRGEIRIYILNSKGEQVYQEVLVNFQGRYDSDIDMTRRIPAGTYYVMLVQDERVMVEQMEVN